MGLSLRRVFKRKHKPLPKRLSEIDIIENQLAKGYPYRIGVEMDNIEYYIGFLTENNLQFTCTKSDWFNGYEIKIYPREVK